MHFSCILTMISATLLTTFVTGNLNLTEQIYSHFSRHYGESCSELEGEACSVKETLACINKTCACADPLTMTYDSSRGLCVGNAGSNCVLHPSESSVPLGRRNPCVSFASCDNYDAKKGQNKNNTCKCWSSFYPDSSSGQCLRKRDHLSTCEDDGQCNDRKGLSCDINLGICKCATNLTIFNDETERCVGLPNEPCANVYRECTENHKCKIGICRCKFKEMESPNGTLICDAVRHKYGKACGRFRGDCGDEHQNNMRCLDGKCRCKNPDYQTYDYDRRVCVSKVGGPCSISNSNITTENKDVNFRNNSKFNASIFPVIQCIPYAQCQIYNTSKSKKNNKKSVSSTHGVCECENGYIESKKGFCHLPFRHECDSSSKNKKDQCASPLKCVNLRCDCQNEIDIYEPDSSKCSKAVHSLCWKDGDCVKNSVCKLKNKALPGRCRCMQKFRATETGSCV